VTSIALHHILLKSPLLAKDILNELTLGARFEDLAAEHSACPSARKHGDCGHHNADIYEYHG
jgi:peptidyl-prolyl cis-trans isomerase C